MTPPASASAQVSSADSDVLLEASKVIAAAVAHSLAMVEEDVSVPGLRVLVMLQHRGAMNLSAVAEALGVNASSASRTCDRLVAGGLVNRREDRSDRRQVSLTLTGRGSRFVDSVLAERRAVLARIVERMDSTARARLIESLGAFVRSAQSLRDETPIDDSTGALLRWLI